MKEQRFMKTVEASVVAVSVLVLGTIDCATGYNLSFFVFYFIPVAVVASRHGAKAAYAISLLCAATCFISDWLGGHPYPSPWMGYWNAAARFAAFVVVAHTIARIRVLLASAQNEVKTLQGFLPICAKCKKIRDDKGYWQQIEAYISKHADVTFSHGLCEQCAAEMLRELEEDGTTEQSVAPLRQPGARPGEGER
jgi:hypothetical protein